MRREVGAQRFIFDPKKRVPVAAEVDVLIAGGGPAGFGAAIGAARAGAKALVIERNNCLGGTATSGLMANLNVTGPHLAGVAHELIYRLADMNGAWLGRVVTFSPELMKQVMLEMLEAERVEILFYTMPSHAIVEND